MVLSCLLSITKEILLLLMHGADRFDNPRGPNLPTDYKKKHVGPFSLLSATPVLFPACLSVCLFVSDRPGSPAVRWPTASAWTLPAVPRPRRTCCSSSSPRRECHSMPGGFRMAMGQKPNRTREHPIQSPTKIGSKWVPQRGTPLVLTHSQILRAVDVGLVVVRGSVYPFHLGVIRKSMISPPIGPKETVASLTTCRVHRFGRQELSMALWGIAKLVGRRSPEVAKRGSGTRKGGGGRGEQFRDFW